MTIILVASMTVAIGFGSIEIQLSTVTDEILNFQRGQATDSLTAKIIFDIRISQIIFAAISGASGRGKSTLMSFLSKTRRSSNVVYFNGQDVDKSRGD